MRLLRACRWGVMLLALCLLVGLTAGCGKKTSKPAANPGETVPSEEETDSDKLAEIHTNFGTLYIPEKYEQLLQTEVSTEGQSGRIRFYTELDGRTYDLFELSVGEEAGQLVGTLTGQNGTPQEVYVTGGDLGDLSELTQDKQDQLYALQEAVNVLIENLK